MVIIYYPMKSSVIQDKVYFNFDENLMVSFGGMIRPVTLIMKLFTPKN